MSEWKRRDEYQQVEELPTRFIARQAILDRSRRTFGYELLFRSGWQNGFSGDAEVASQTVLDNAVAHDLYSLLGSAVPFVNCTRSILVDDFASLLPHGSVLEILEDVTVDEALIRACKRLQGRGYRIALDDYDFHEKWEQLLPMADFIKIDFLASTPEQRKHIVQRFRRNRPVLLAEKIETESDFQVALTEGFELFQGYFFERPTVVARPSLGTLVQRLQLIALLRDEELSTERILVLLKTETALALRLLRLANSAAVGSRDPISDVRRALTLVGHERFRQLAIITLVSEVAGNNVPEFQRHLLQRARFCEALSTAVGHGSDELFFFGVFSLLQPVLGLTPQEIASTVPLAGALQSALFGAQNQVRALVDSLAHFQRGEWQHFAASAERLGMPQHSLAEQCSHAQRWASQMVAVASAVA